MEQCVKALGKRILCRDSLIRMLYSFLISDELVIDNFFIYGHTGTGKTLVIRELLEHFGHRFSIVNCIEYTSSKPMFEKIILDLSGEKLCQANNYKMTRKCDNNLDFAKHLRDLVSDESLPPIIIVFEKCERIRDMDDVLWAALHKLREGVYGLQWGKNIKIPRICVIFSSNIVYEHFVPQIGLPTPVMIHFPQYEREEVFKILMHYKDNKSYDDEFYANYLNLFLSTYYFCCRDLNELRYMAQKNFIEYIKPIEKGITKKTDSSSLWKNIKGTFSKNLEVLYLRLSNEDFAKQDLEIESTKKLALSFELPYYAKYLLIAGFLASYNPAKEDKRLFMKHTTKMKKRSKVAAKAVVVNATSGPRSFLLNRMIAIFASIIEEKVDISATLMSQIQTMCHLGLLDVVGDQTNIDEPKYRCCVGKEFIEVISHNVGFELRHYLYDRMHD